MATKADFKRLSKKWSNIFNLWGNKITLDFKDKWDYDNGAQTSSSHALEDADKMLTVVTTSIPIYKIYTMDINTMWLKQATLEDVEETICHEYLHMLYSPLITFVQTLIEREVDDVGSKSQVYHEWLRDVNETVTTTVAKLVYDLSKDE